MKKRPDRGFVPHRACLADITIMSGSDWVPDKRISLDSKANLSIVCSTGWPMVLRLIKIE